MTADLKFHPLSDLFPLLEGVEFDELVADIKANGIEEPIALWQGKILDGRNRYRAGVAAGIDPNIRTYDLEDRWAGHEGFDPVAYVISKNLRRRHLTAEQKRDLITKLLKASPGKSDREIGRLTKTDNKTVASVRAEQERREEIPHVSTRTDTKGRKQPATKRKSKQPAPKPVKHDDRIISPELGERVGRFADKLIRLDRELARELADLILQRGVVERLWADLGTSLKIVERAS
jgi:hypothetical protein